MKETITLYKQVHTNELMKPVTTTIELHGFHTVAKIEVEVEFPEFDTEEAQREAIKAEIKAAKERHQAELEQLEIKAGN